MKVSCIIVQLFLSSLLLSGYALPLPAQWAQTVSVDTQAENAVLAKEKGLNDGERQAFIKLIHVISPQGVSNETLIRETAAKCSGGYEVQEEKFSGTRYRAKVLYHFHDRCVLADLANLGMSAQASSAPPQGQVRLSEPPLLLVVDHALEHRGQEAASPWHESAMLTPVIYNHFADQKARVIFPLHDLTDQTLLPAISLDALTFGPFQALAQHYQTDAIHLVVLTKQNDTMTLTAYGITPFKTTLCARADISSTIRETEDSKAQRVAELAFATLTSCSRSAISTSEPPAAAPTAAGTAAPQLTHISTAEATSSCSAQVHFDSLQSWLHLKKLLTFHPSVQKIDLRELGHQTALFSVQLKTSLKAWQAQLNELGLVTNQISERSITIKAATTIE